MNYKVRPGATLQSSADIVRNLTEHCAVCERELGHISNLHRGMSHY